MYSSAGILPFAVVDDKIYLLLGCESTDGTWSDFGGKMETEDGHNPQRTACREFMEETLGVVTNFSEINLYIQNSPCLQGCTYSGQKYYMYVVRIQWSPHHSTYFAKAHQLMGRIQPTQRKLLEKRCIRWFSYADILRADRSSVRLRSVFNDSLLSNINTINQVFRSVCC